MKALKVNTSKLTLNFCNVSQLLKSCVCHLSVENKCLIVLNGQQVLGIGAWPQKRRLHRCWLYVGEWCTASSRT
jgi:hypothetical protein